MLFSSDNNCNNSIETIIKDKITLIDNNNNNNLINSDNNNLINQNLTSNFNKLNNLNKQNPKLDNYANLNFCSIWTSPSPSRPDYNIVNPLLLSPLEKENAKEIIQRKILDNVIFTQKLNEQNEELAHYLANINEENNKNNVLLSPIDLISKNSNSLILENGINNNVYVGSNLSLNNLAPEPNIINENSLFMNSSVFSPESNNGEELGISNKTNEIMNLDNILNSNPEVFLNATTATPTGAFISTPETTILSSPLTDIFLSSPESNNLSSPELYDNLSIAGTPELNLNNNSSIINDTTVDNYLLNQEFLKLQQESLLNTVENQVPGSSLYLNNGLIMSSPESSPELYPELLNQSINISDPLQQILDDESKIVKMTSLENKEEDLDIENNDEEEMKEKEEKEEKELINEDRCNKKESIINEGKPFIYVITESDDEEESSCEDDIDKKKKKYKKKYYVCSVCNHKSKRHYNVEVHLKTHEKNRPRPFICEICKKCFCRAHDLERHKVIHKEKMFSCPLCTKKFGRLDSLKRHIGCKTCIKKQQLIRNEK